MQIIPTQIVTLATLTIPTIIPAILIITEIQVIIPAEIQMLHP
jgi:hypothetical protein